MSILDLVRPELRALRGYSSARMESGAGGVLLNANESFEPALLGDGSVALNRYPEPQPRRLLEPLAELLGVPPDAVLLTRGSDEAIDLLTRAFCRAGNDAVLVSPPTFGMYAVCAAVQGAALVHAPLDGARFLWDAGSVLAAADSRVRLVFVCSPNNPTGALVPADSILALARALEGRALVVVDEAYIDYAAAPSLARAAAAGRLAVLRTLSKAHALAGARVGALVAEPALIAMLRRILAPYPLPTPSIDAAIAALAPQALARTALRIATTLAERERVAAALRCTRGVIDVLPSRANFLLVRFDDAPAALAILAAVGITVRDVARHEPALASHLRISIGAPAENDALLGALERATVAA